MLFGHFLDTSPAPILTVSKPKPSVRSHHYLYGLLFMKESQEQMSPESMLNVQREGEGREGEGRERGREGEGGGRDR